MSRRLRFKREARADIRKATAWYHTRAAGLGDDYLDEVEAALEHIQRNPAAYRIIRGAVRRLNLRRFPYAIFFTVRERDIVVVGCLHQRRDPAVWQSRACAGVARGTYLFALPGSPGAVKDGWDGILKYQLDIRHKPCNFVDIMPRLEEHRR